jgi:glutamate racemase
MCAKPKPFDVKDIARSTTLVRRTIANREAVAKGRPLIGVFDSGFGGLTVHHTLIKALPQYGFTYLGDHAHAPYGERPFADIKQLTARAMEQMFELGCGLIVIACNTASAVALRWLQQDWLPEQERWRDRNILGIIVPTIEAATSRPWSDKPGLEFPAHLVADVKSLGIFGTRGTVESQTYPVEIHKRRADIAVFQQSCPELAGAIEAGTSDPDLRPLIRGYVDSLLQQTDGLWPDRLILACTHYPLVAHLFREFLPEIVPLIAQPDIVAARLVDYLKRHPGYVEPDRDPVRRYFSTGAIEGTLPLVRTFWRGDLPFARLA